MKKYNIALENIFLDKIYDSDSLPTAAILDENSDLKKPFLQISFINEETENTIWKIADLWFNSSIPGGNIIELPGWGMFDVVVLDDDILYYPFWSAKEAINFGHVAIDKSLHNRCLQVGVTYSGIYADSLDNSIYFCITKKGKVMQECDKNRKKYIRKFT